MTTRRRFTLTQYLIEQRRRFPGASGDFNALLLDVALACKAIARSVAFGELASVLGHAEPAVTTTVNVQGEDELAHVGQAVNALMDTLERSERGRAVAAEQLRHAKDDAEVSCLISGFNNGVFVNGAEDNF